MFFPLSKILWALVDPANLMALLFLAAAVALCFGRRRIGGGLFAGGLVILVLLGVFPVGHNALFYLETRYAAPTALPERVDGIVVLGGAIETQKSERSGRPEFNEGAERILSAMALSRRFPSAQIVFSGGSGHLTGSKRSEAVDIAIFLDAMGFDMGRVRFEDTSRNTFENITNTKAMVAPGAAGNWVLVTSGFHMPRSMAIARRQGWMMIPYPVDYRSRGRYGLLPEKFDVLDNLYAAKLFLREVTGYAAYKITGRL